MLLAVLTVHVETLRSHMKQHTHCLVVCADHTSRSGLMVWTSFPSLAADRLKFLFFLVAVDLESLGLLKFFGSVRVTESAPSSPAPTCTVFSFARPAE